MGAYSADVISTCLYGIETDAMDRPQHPFLKSLINFFGVDITYNQLLSIIFPRIAKLLKLSFFNLTSIRYLSELTKQVLVEKRKLHQGSNVKVSNFNKG